MRTAPASYLDPRTGRTYPLTDRRWRSDDDHPLMVTALPGLARGEIEVRDRSIWRYRAAFPVAIDRPVSMGEGGTPLIQKDWDGLRPFFKLEWFNPTCSFKDRGAALLISFLRQLGVKAVIEDSSDNGGAAVAAFGAAAGLAVKVLAPSDTPAAKVAQMGRPRLHRARQRDRSHGGRQQLAGMPHRVHRTAESGADCPAAPPVCGAATHLLAG